MRDDLFWEKVDRSGGEAACWPYMGARFHFGHGAVQRGGRPLKAHRYAWRQCVGEIPEGLFVCHHCDNPPCCNPAHLFLGTALDNMRDKVRKGRHVSGAKGRFKTHCIHGHELPPPSQQNRFGARVCRECAKAARQRYERRKNGKTP